MKTRIAILSLAALICGCNRASDPRVSILTNQLAQLQARIDSQGLNLTNQIQQFLRIQTTFDQSISSEVSNLAIVQLALIAKSAPDVPVNPATGLPFLPPGSAAIEVDPATGLPSPKIVNVLWRVTEQNSTWWKYSYQFWIGNLGNLAETVDAQVNALDSAGFIVDHESEYNLQLPGQSTNRFAGTMLVDLPAAATVQKLSVTLSLKD